MMSKFLFSIAFICLVANSYAQDFLTLSGADVVQESTLSEEELSLLVEDSSGGGRESLEAAQIDMSVVSGLYAQLRYDRELAKERFELTDAEVDKLLARIDVARAVQREVNATSKSDMCRHWQDSELFGDARVVEAMGKYDSATGNAKSTVDDAYKAVVADVSNTVNRAAAVKILNYIGASRMSVARGGRLFTLSDTIARSANGGEYLENLCGR